MIGHPAIYAGQCIASALAVALAARSRAHLPIAMLIPFGLACDVALEVVGPAPVGLRFGAGVMLGSVYPWAAWAAVVVVLRKDEGPGGHPSSPHAPPVVLVPSAARLSGSRPETVSPVPHTDQGGRLVPCGPGGGGGRPSPQPTPALAIAQALAGWLPCVALILATGIRGTALARVYAGMQATVALALAVTIVRWRRLHEPRTATATCAIICAAAECANIPAYLGLPSWWSARAVYALAYGVLVYLQGRALWRLTCRSN